MFDSFTLRLFAKMFTIDFSDYKFKVNQKVFVKYKGSYYSAVVQQLLEKRFERKPLPYNVYKRKVPRYKVVFDIDNAWMITDEKNLKNINEEE